MSDAPAVSPAILLAMTAVTGIVDAVSFLAMGRVFTANMTGNVVLLGFAFAGAPGLSISRSSVALIAFLAGAVAGGRMTLDVSGRRWVSRAFLVEASLLALSAALATINPLQPYAVIASTAVAMGLRNAVVRKLGVPDLTTTVLTLTITGLAADSRIGRRRQSPLAATRRRDCGDARRSCRRRSNGDSLHFVPACHLQRHHGRMRNRACADRFKTETVMKIVIGFVLSFVIGAGCRYFDIPAASPPVIPGALIVLAMTLGYTSMDRVLIRKDRAATTKPFCGGPTGLPKAMADSVLKPVHPSTRNAAVGSTRIARRAGK